MTLNMVGDHVHRCFPGDLVAGQLLQHAVEIELGHAWTSEDAIVGRNEVVFQVGLGADDAVLLNQPRDGVDQAASVGFTFAGVIRVPREPSTPVVLGL
jgi:hypothetical protein